MDFYNHALGSASRADQARGKTQKENLSRAPEDQGLYTLQETRRPAQKAAWPIPNKLTMGIYYQEVT
jgi:hypothetical protein